MDDIKNWFEKTFAFLKPDQSTSHESSNKGSLELALNRIPPGLTAEKIQKEIHQRVSKETGNDRVKELFSYE